MFVESTQNRTRMAKTPETSATLLRDVAGDADNPRWGEFIARYRPAMVSFMAERFPGLEPDDIIQETFIAVAKALPNYRYVPQEKGHFHNFLTGILRNKALNALRSARRHSDLLEKFAAEPRAEAQASEDEQRHWRETIYEIALQQLMANPNIAQRSKQIFIRTAIKGERPEAVAESLIVSRDVVDQTKKRMTERLRKAIDRLRNADGN